MNYEEVYGTFFPTRYVSKRFNSVCLTVRNTIRIASNFKVPTPHGYESNSYTLEKKKKTICSKCHNKDTDEMLCGLGKVGGFRERERRTGKEGEREGGREGMNMNE